MEIIFAILVIASVIFAAVKGIIFINHYVAYLVMKFELRNDSIGSDKYLKARNKFSEWIKNGKIYDYRYNDIYFCNSLSQEEKDLMEVVLMDLNPSDYKKLMMYSISLIDKCKMNNKR